MEQEKKVAKSSEVKPRYDLIESEFLHEIAKVLSEGAERYGEKNYQRGDAAFVRDRWNHIIEHLEKWKDGDFGESHLAHAACGLMFLYWYDQNQPSVAGEAFGWRVE